ncbi:MAG: hypothetical protein J6U64_05925 [Alphaproteobacteria bacterium]|nr:hypothetical protein [Alphaproteobacteria bacterium]
MSAMKFIKKIKPNFLQFVQNGRENEGGCNKKRVIRYLIRIKTQFKTC